MKTIKRLLLLGLVLAALLPAASLAQEEYWNIGELRERAQTGWTQTYETKWRVDAQTGEPVRESKAYDRCEYKGFLSWDDVNGKR